MSRKKSKEFRFDFQAVFEPEDYLYFYQDTLTKERTEKEIAFLVRELKLDRPKKILDLACGYGRHSNRLAQLGHQMVGVDLTPGFLKIAKAEARKKRLQVKYLHQDMRKIKFKAEFDRVFLLFTAFGYFSDWENFQVLKKISRSLKPGGLFCMDSFNYRQFLKDFRPLMVKEKGRDLMIERNYFDPASSRIYNRRIVVRNGKRKDKPFFIRIYQIPELKKLLARAGMRIMRIYGDWDDQKLSHHSRRMIIIAQKL